MQFLRIAFMLASITVVASGCVSSADYDAMVLTLKTDASARANAQKSCIAKTEQEPRATRTQLAAYIGVSYEAYPRELCRRLQGAMISGRMTYEDYVDVMSGRRHEGGDDQFFRMLRKG